MIGLYTEIASATYVPSLVWPDPWMGCVCFERTIKDLVTLASTTNVSIVVEPIKFRGLLKDVFCAHNFSC